jgi:hypothetical protein
MRPTAAILASPWSERNVGMLQLYRSLRLLDRSFPPLHITLTQRTSYSAWSPSLRPDVALLHLSLHTRISSNNVKHCLQETLGILGHFWLPLGIANFWL